MFVVSGGRIDGTIGLADDEAVIRVGTGWLRGRGDADPAAVFGGFGGVVNKILAMTLEYLGRPEITIGPGGGVRQDGSNFLPMDQISGMKNGKNWPRIAGSACRPEITADADNGRVGMIAGDDRIFVEVGASLDRLPP